MTGKHLRVLSPRARRRRLIQRVIEAIIYVLFALAIILGVLMLLGCASEAVAELMKM